jgi:hypothetical protein
MKDWQNQGSEHYSTVMQTMEIRSFEKSEISRK